MRRKHCGFHCVQIEAKVLPFGGVQLALFLKMLRFPSAQREYLIDLIGFSFFFFLRHLVASRTAEVKKTICFVKSQTNNTS